MSQEQRIVIRPKKSLSQNFLLDKNISRKIVNNFNCTTGDLVLEIGPGTGSLTEFLIDTGAEVFAVELDSRAVDVLCLNFTNKQNFTLVNSDILEIKIDDVLNKYKNHKKLKVIGNIPYKISSEIFFWLFKQADKIDSCMLMIQKELAQRLAAKSHSKEYGILSIALGLVGTAKVLFDVPSSCFYPKPKVTSSIIEFKFEHNEYNALYFSDIMKIVRLAFNQRRKTLRNSLYKRWNNKPIELFVNELEVYANKRAEELSVQDFIQLYKYLKT